ncbi:MAG TPA: trehalose-6-phosphate synthase [Vicinamibacteria bacterium]|jgi:trehalose 6-phosphate synthase
MGVGGVPAPGGSPLKALIRMRLRFLLALLTGLALLTWGASLAVTSTARAWSDRELALRAQLAADSTRRAILASWRAGDHAPVRDVLADMSRDERIMGAAACAADGRRVVSTAEYPVSLACAGLARRLETTAGHRWHGVETVPGGNVHVSALPVGDEEGTVGFVVVVQDMTFAERREAWIGRVLLFAFAILSAAAALVTMLAQRLSWRGWTAELRRLLDGARDREEPTEFQPLMQDVRALVDRLGDAQAEVPSGSWSAARLRNVLHRHLRDERLVVVANREPYIHERTESGIRLVHPASGLVTALEPVMRACSGVWVAHGSGSADRITADAHGEIRVPPGEESYVLHRVWLTREEEKGYYYGFANEGLWPLCHIAYTRPAFRHADWEQYRKVNQRFAEAACEAADSEDPVVLVQDYHFALVPRLVRERLPRATILSFWHIPWPNAEQFGVCPWRDELLDGMLGSSILGFQTQRHCQNFIDGVDRYLEARIDRENAAVVQGPGTTLVRPYPISIEWPARWMDGLPPVDECRRAVRAELGLDPGTLLGLGVDRLDYTKGIEERLLAVERLLERYPRYRERFVFVQIAAPSRTEIERYRQLSERVHGIAERINSRFGGPRYRPVILLPTHHEPPSVFRHYRAADFCYVSSLDDGMNLVAKEFVAARDDEAGVLVLSHFTGAARELAQALVVNPYDIEQASAALATALEMPPREQRERMRAMRALVSEFNVYRWAGRILVDAARVRGRERLNGRLMPRAAAAGNGGRAAWAAASRRGA